MFYTVISTDNEFLIPKKFAGMTYLVLIFIKPEYKNDFGLLHHEMTHVKQFYKNPLHSFLYKFSKKYRLKSEVEAYKEQLNYYDVDRSQLFAQFISEKYNLDITVEQAQQLLKS